MHKKSGLPEKNLGPSDDTAESTMNLNISVNDMQKYFGVWVNEPGEGVWTEVKKSCEIIWANVQNWTNLGNRKPSKM